MTVDELIAELRKHPGECPVYIRGYEGGVNDVEHVVCCQVIRDVNEASYYGRHEPLDVFDGGRWVGDDGVPHRVRESGRTLDDIESGVYLWGGSEDEL